MAVTQEVVIPKKKHSFLLKVIAFNLENSYKCPFFKALRFFISQKQLQPSISQRVLYLCQKDTCSYLLCLFQTYCYFKGALPTIHFEWYRHYLERPFVAIKIFQGQCASLKRCSCPFVKEPFLYHKTAVVAMYYFKFTVFFRTSAAIKRNHNCQLSYQLRYFLGCRRVFVERCYSFVLNCREIE